MASIPPLGAFFFQGDASMPEAQAVAGPASSITPPNSERTQVRNPELRAQLAPPRPRRKSFSNTGNSLEKADGLRLPNGLRAVVISDPASSGSIALSFPLNGLPEYEARALVAALLCDQLLPSGATSDGWVENGIATFTLTMSSGELSEALPGFLDSFTGFELTKRALQSAKNASHPVIEEPEEAAQWIFATIHQQDERLSTRLSLSPATLMEAYKSVISSHTMSVVLRAPQPLKLLVPLATERFGELPQRLLPVRQPALILFSPETAGCEIVATAPEELHSFSLYWPLPDSWNSPKAERTIEAAADLLTSEYEGGWVNQLQKQGLLLRAEGGKAVWDQDNRAFQLKLFLTPLGVESRPSILTLLFQAIPTIGASLTPELIDSLSFALKDEEPSSSRKDDAEVASFNAAREGITYLLKEAPIYPDSLASLLGELKPNNSHTLLLGGQDLAPYPDKETHIAEIQYRQKKLSAPYLKRLAQPNGRIKVASPIPTPWLPGELTLAPKERMNKDPLAAPLAITSSRGARIYFKQDKAFLNCKLTVLMNIVTSAIDVNDPDSVVKGDLFAALAKRHLSGLIAEGRRAKIHTELERDGAIYSLKVHGLSPKLPQFLLTLLESWKNLPLTPEAWRQQVQETRDQLSLLSHKSEDQLALDLLEKQRLSHYCSIPERVAALSRIQEDYDSYKTFHQTVLSQLYLQGVICGNATIKEAKLLGKSIQETLAAEAFSPPQQPKTRAIEACDGANQVTRIDSPGSGESVILSIGCGPNEPQREACFRVLMELLAENPSIRAVEREGELFAEFINSSQAGTARNLLTEIDSALQQFLERLESGDEEVIGEFELAKTTTIGKLEHFVSCVEEMAHYQFDTLFQRRYDFDWIPTELATLSELAYPEFLGQALELLGPGNTDRLQLVVSGEGAAAE